MDIAQVKATIDRGNEAVRAGIVLMTGVREQSEHAHVSAATTAHDSNHQQIADGLRKLREALRESSRVADLLRSSTEAANEYGSKL
jgi:hypothetical protein